MWQPDKHGIIKGPPESHPDFDPNPEVTWRFHRGESGTPSSEYGEVPLLTASIDAALMLVPEGWAWFVERIGEPFSEGDARIWIPSKRTKGLKCEDVDVRNAKSPPIALCIAALKVRATLAGEGK